MALSALLRYGAADRQRNSYFNHASSENMLRWPSNAWAAHNVETVIGPGCGVWKGYDDDSKIRFDDSHSIGDVVQVFGGSL
jgi:hypothetical protein